VYRGYYQAVRAAGLASLAALALVAAAGAARADTSKLAREDTPIQPKEIPRGKNKTCCGYPLVHDAGFKLRFYWLALETDFDEPDEIGFADPDQVDLYTRDGWFLGSFPDKFAWSLRMEGSGLLADGRVINYTGRCAYGYGTCFQILDVDEYPFGRGARRLPITPFKSVAVDPRLIPIGEPLYIPELDGLVLPDGSIHDGCVRADDTGGGIKKNKMDFFVVTYGNFRFLLDELTDPRFVTPYVEAPRCEYLRDYVGPRSTD
jgi:3D (Asp-Asp-Asp) domain-containing protein